MEQPPSGRSDGCGDSGLTPGGAGSGRAPGIPIDAHTPAPWVLGRTGRPSTLAIFRETNTSRELVAAFADHTVTYADARLMTRAPEMLAALRAFIEPYSGKPAETFSADHKSRIDAARAAIAAVEGNS